MNNTVNYDALKYIQGQTKIIRKTNNTFCCLFVKMFLIRIQMDAEHQTLPQWCSESPHIRIAYTIPLQSLNPIIFAHDNHLFAGLENK